MDIISILGVIGGLIVITVGIIVGGASPLSYFSLSAIFITIGGVFFATIASNTYSNFRKVFLAIRVAFSPEEKNSSQIILTLLSFSEKARRECLLALEEGLEEVNDEFFKSGIQLVVDGTEPELVKGIMSSEIDALDTRHGEVRKIISDIATFCPAFGMIGTIIGLVVMMNQLGGDPAAIGKGMAAALLTTLYGVIMANVIFIPIANKLEKKNITEVTTKEIILEGTLSIQSGDNPRILQQQK